MDERPIKMYGVDFSRICDSLADEREDLDNGRNQKVDPTLSQVAGFVCQYDGEQSRPNHQRSSVGAGS